MPRGHPYSPEQIAYVAECASAGHTDRETAGLLNARFGTAVGRNAVSMIRKTHGIPCGFRTVDREGREVTITQKPRELLSERLNAQLGYWMVKVGYRSSGRQNDQWVQRSIFEWEKANGRPLPPGHVVLHADHDKANDAPGNLVLASKRQWAVIVGKGWRWETREELEGYLSLASVILAANDLEDAVDPDNERRRARDRSIRSRERRREARNGS